MEAPIDLKEKMIEALKSNRYFITISYKMGDPPNDLKHFWVTKEYPKDELLNTLNHFKDETMNKEIRRMGSETEEWL